MKVILQQDVKGQGKKGQLIEVSNGYARNYLLPRKLAVEATPENLNAVKIQEKARLKSWRTRRPMRSRCLRRLRVSSSGSPQNPAAEGFSAPSLQRKFQTP